MFDVFRLRHHLQILRPIVFLVFVLVMDYFARQQWPSEHLLCDYAMLVPAIPLYVSARSRAAILCNDDNTCGLRSGLLLASPSAELCPLGAVRFYRKLRSALLAEK
jgi:hypothetical protein